jgi:hypothetical protein
MTRTAALLALLVSSTAACTQKGDAPSRSADPTPAQKAAEPAPAPAAVALVDHDLASRGAAWSGWTIKGPKDATFEASEGTFPGSTAITWSKRTFLIGFRQGTLDFAHLKAEVLPFTVGKTTITRETPDVIETTQVLRAGTIRCFYQNAKVGGVDVGCWTASCPVTDADLATAHQICDSLSKK